MEPTHTMLHTPSGTREDRREIRECSRLPRDPAAAVADLVERVCHRWGGAKALAGDAVPEGYSQIRRWAGDGDIPNLRQIMRLVDLAGPEDPFRPALLGFLEHVFDPSPPDPEHVAAEIAARLDGKRATPAKVAEVVKTVLAEVKPGVWGRAR